MADWATLTEATPPTPPPVAQRSGIGSNTLWYRFLRNCAQLSCSQTNDYVVGFKLENLCNGGRCRYTRDQVTELETEGDWSKVRINRNGGEGWLPTTDIDWQ